MSTQIETFLQMAAARRVSARVKHLAIIQGPNLSKRGANNFYFSTPKVVIDKDAGLKTPTIIITPKYTFDRQGSWDCTSTEYRGFLQRFDLKDVLDELEENIYQPGGDSITCAELRTLVEKVGFVHNPNLDKSFREWARDNEYGLSNS